MRALIIIFQIFISFLFAQNDEKLNTKITDEMLEKDLFYLNSGQPGVQIAQNKWVT